MVQRIIYTSIFFTFCLMGCTSPKDKQKEKKPVVIISEIYDQDRFADILFDLTMVEAAYRLNMANEESVKKRNEIYRDVLLSHETDSTVFDENWTYYGYRPEKMQEVYDLVLEKIEVKRVERGAMPTKKEDEE